MVVVVVNDGEVPGCWRRRPTFTRPVCWQYIGDKYSSIRS